MVSASIGAGVAGRRPRAWCHRPALLDVVRRILDRRLVKSPRLYFHDVGLAAYLLGIQTDSHVLAHPLRGALLETLVIGEALKWFWHRGRPAPLHFYRDSEGNEVDLIVERRDGVFPIEIKAGETINPDYFRGLRALARLYDAPLPNGGAIVLGGADTQIRHATTIIPATRMHELMRSISGS
jgi:uncharacterized protein